MKHNVGKTDQVIRLTIGSMLIILSIFGIIGWWGYIGILPLVTGIIRYCPLYPFLKIDTTQFDK